MFLLPFRFAFALDFSVLIGRLGLCWWPGRNGHEENCYSIILSIPRGACAFFGTAALLLGFELEQIIEDLFTQNKVGQIPKVFTTHVNKAKCATCPRDSHGKIHRSSSAKNAFKASHPCPATGKTSGPCRGYVIDHVKPLASGGADDLSNMEWQTKAEAKAKDKWERR